MSKFNMNINKNVRNYEGGKSFLNDEKFDIVSIVLNSYFNPNEFYQNQEDRINSIIKLLKNNESEFIAKLAVYSRKEGNLRSVSHVLIILLAEENDKSGNLRKMVYKSVQRVDDMTEIVSLWNQRHPKEMLPNAIRRAFRDILNEKRFDEYQLKKYEQKRKKVKLRDIIRISKPSKNLDLYKKVLDENLDKITTIHRNISQEKSARDIFLELYSKNKLGYLEVLKMTSKIFEDGFDANLFIKYKDYILNEKRILNSKALPFRFYQAYNTTKEINDKGIYSSKELSFKNRLKDVLEKAFFISTKTDNFINEDEKIAIMIDDSYSMSDVSIGLSLFNHALLLATSIAYNIKKENLKLYFWSDRCEERSFNKDKAFDFIDNTQECCGGTYFDKPFEILLRDKIKVDKAIILTDCQMYGYSHFDEDFKTYVNKYKNEVNKDIKVLFWDLAGYGVGTPIKISDNILEANGISSKMLQFVPKLWDDKQALIKEIQKVEL